MEKSQQMIHKLEIFFILFIPIQPILDVTAYFHLPISEPVRILAMITGGMYIFLYYHQRVRSLSLIYFSLLGIVLFTGLLNNFFVKDSFSLSIELVYLIKTTYFVVMLISYFLVFQSLRQKRNLQKIVQKNIFIALSIIGIVMALAALSETGKRSYDYLSKSGHSGWFYSANEVSAIIAMGFAMMILYFIKMKRISFKLVLLLPITLVIWSGLTIGTKVGLGGIIIVLIVSIILTLTEGFIKKRWHNAVLLSLILAMALIYFPKAPIANNLGLTLSKIQDQSAPHADQVPSDDYNTEIVLSGRSDFLKTQMEQFQDAPFSQKLFGMGRGGNYEEIPKLIEMDFMDWFFNFGIIGFSALILPLLYFGWRIIKGVLLQRFHMGANVLLTGTGVILGLGTAFVAGHVLSSPAASIYLAVFIALLDTLISDKTGHLTYSKQV